MTFYLVSFDKQFLRFQKAHDFLSEARVLDSGDALRDCLSRVENDGIFFIDFEGRRSEKDEFVLDLRGTGKDIRIIYVSSKDLGDLASHQQTPAGGDSYIPSDIPTEELTQLLATLGTESRRQVSGAAEAFELGKLEAFKAHPKSRDLDAIFRGATSGKKANWQREKEIEDQYDLGEDMSKKESADLTLDEEFELGEDFSLSDDSEGLALGESDEVLSLGDEEPGSDFGELSLSEDSDDELSLDEETPLADVKIDAPEGVDDFSLSLDAGEELALSEDLEFAAPLEDDAQNFGDLSLDEAPAATAESEPIPEEAPEESGIFAMDDVSEISDEVREKLKEIDAIMDGTSKIDIKNPEFVRKTEAPVPEEAMTFEAEEEVTPETHEDQNINESLVSDEVNVAELGFAAEEEPEIAPEPEAPKKKKKKEAPAEVHQSFKEISGAYSGELERLQATISNLRADRDELIKKIQTFEDNEVLQKRSQLSLRAELDEKKIELSIIRRKLNDEISELKDQVRLLDEKKLIADEKVKLLQQEVEKAGQRSRLDVKRVQLRERELEQKLELLKADAETQIRNRDLKILELKRKIDAMEFDMESISTQEKKSVESRFELEDKLDKAIKTLRSAITVLEDEGRSVAAETLKKNIDV